MVELLSILVSKKVVRIETIDQLIRENDISVLVVKNSLTHKALKNVKYQLF
jgi:ribosomal protein L10